MLSKGPSKVKPIIEDEIEDVRVARNFVNMSLGELRQHEKGILKIVEDDNTVLRR